MIALIQSAQFAPCPVTPFPIGSCSVYSCPVIPCRFESFPVDPFHVPSSQIESKKLKGDKISMIALIPSDQFLSCQCYSSLIGSFLVVPCQISSCLLVSNQIYLKKRVKYHGLCLSNLPGFIQFKLSHVKSCRVDSIPVDSFRVKSGHSKSYRVNSTQVQSLQIHLIEGR